MSKFNYSMLFWASPNTQQAVSILQGSVLFQFMDDSNTVMWSVRLLLKLMYNMCTWNKNLFHHRRQSSRCFQDYQETLTQRFALCNNVLEEIQDSDVLPLNATNAFCQQHCPSYLIRLAQKLTVDCDLPDTLVRICD